MYSANWTNSFARLPDTFYSRVKPTPFEQLACWVHFNEAADIAVFIMISAPKHVTHCIGAYGQNRLHKLSSVTC